MTQSRKFTALAALAAVSALALPSPALAQATRTWVSGVGDDANPCSRTAPCKTFQGAISKTAAGGEINCLDSGGFGGVSITKSIAIICDEVIGGVLAAGAGISAITVNAAATDAIYLSGLDISGAGSATNGVRVLSAASVHIYNSKIRNFRGTGSSGISFQPGVSTELYVVNTSIADNGSGGAGNGILIQPTGAGGAAKVSISNVTLQDNGAAGIRIDSTDNTNTAGIVVTIDETQISGNSSAGIAAVAPATNPISGTIVDSTISHNSAAGIVTNGSVLLRVGNTTITANSRGVNAVGGSQILSYGDNRLDGNPAVGTPNEGTFTGTVIPKQ
jgi:hypothetical protein